MLKSEEFQDYEFENDTPLKCRQFIWMVHINDRMIAYTSDSISYLLKFNYDKVINGYGFPKYENRHDFAGVVQKANLQEILQSTDSKQSLPQLVYLKTSNFFSVSKQTLLIILVFLKWKLMKISILQIKFIILQNEKKEDQPKNLKDVDFQELGKQV